MSDEPMTNGQIRAEATTQWIASKGVDLRTPKHIKELGTWAVLAYQDELTKHIRHDPNRVLDGHPNEP